MYQETERKVSNGVGMLLILLVVAVVGIWQIVVAATYEDGVPGAIGAFLLFLVILGLSGLFTVAPNQGRVLTLFGTYKGTVKATGLWWTNPFMKKEAVSLRVRNFETSKIKVNDHDSNPIEIGAIIVWQVVDTAEAMFEVDNYPEYMQVQSEAAVRTLASSYPYDSHRPEQRSLSQNAAEISEQLAVEVQNRLSKAGMKVLEARIAHLAYAPEIANAMLRRQQASAIIAAREKIVEGAVSMVDMALQQITEKGMVALDDERKATMVSNLMVTLCAEQPMQPVINTGTLY